MDRLFALNLAEVPPQTIQAAAGIAIVAGLLYCFLGYRLLKLAIGLIGFLLSGATAGALAGWATQGNMIFMVGAALLGGACGAASLLFAYKVGVLCLGGLGGVVIAHTVLGGRSDSWAPSVILASGVFGGLVALVFERTLTTVATAAIGAWLVVQGATFLLAGSGRLGIATETIRQPESQYILLACWAVLATVGAVLQFMTRRKPA